jgi:hypothetical protein
MTRNATHNGTLAIGGVSSPFDSLMITESSDSSLKKSLQFN